MKYSCFAVKQREDYMKLVKRVIIATTLGFLTGLVCYWGMKSSGRVELTTAMMIGTILNRALIGFIIGISAWRIHYLLHGVIIGLIATLPMGVYPLVEGQIVGFVMFMVAGAVYGLIIELLTTKLFKAPIRKT